MVFAQHHRPHPPFILHHLRTLRPYSIIFVLPKTKIMDDPRHKGAFGYR